jgi:hypothetical protein
MRILIVAMSNSIHTARWIAQLKDTNWDVHLFPSIDHGIIHGRLQNVTFHQRIYAKQLYSKRNVKISGIPLCSTFIHESIRNIFKKNFPRQNPKLLRKVISEIKPDIIHSCEMQHAGYLTLTAKISYKGKFPPWIVGNWGSDISLFGRIVSHADKIRRVLASCDYYHCECQRDVGLARDFGFKGETLPVSPVSGGFDIKSMRSLRQPGLTSRRKVIALKGYQSWAGRALVGLRAIELCADLLYDYRIIIYLANPDVKLAAELVSHSTGIQFEFKFPGRSHEEILQIHGSARISIGLSIGDAISTSLLEAMIMGSFPIQSDTGCGDEWITDGENGLLVHPNSPEDVADALRQALQDDELVDRAAEINAGLTETRVDQSIVQPMVIDMYQKVAQQGLSKKTE